VYESDYILRHIEQLGAILAELRRRLLGGEAPSGVARDLSRATRGMGLDLSLLREFSLDTLHMFAAASGEIEPARCWLMAEVLFIDALASDQAGDATHAEESYLKSRALFEMIRPAGGMLVGLREAVERVREIDARLERLEEGPATA